jgi:predicted ATPase/DNA-binding SARP family transcriptional activator
VDFRVLGPLEAGDGRELLVLGPPKQRALLARLLLEGGRTVSIERLLEDLWGEDLPHSAVKMVQIYVSGLRKVVGTGRLLTERPGYRLVLSTDDGLDLQRFEELAAAGRAALVHGDPSSAAARLQEALALWRGAALGEFTAEPFARAEGGRLEELRLAAQEDRIEAELALGRAPSVVGDLEALIARHPLRERLREQLMLALYRAGRPGDALAAYHGFRRTLDEELGLDPSPRLRQLEQAILTHDPGLDASVPARAPAPAVTEVPPGRARELQALSAALEGARTGSRRLVLVCGEPGIGKSTLVEALLSAAPGVLLIRGHCVEQQGPGEAYLPLLDGLGGLADDAEVAAAIAARAPSWLPHIPRLAAGAADDGARGATRERMLRELVETLEALAAARPVILFIEDLQWADPSTRDLLGALMRRRHPARLLVVATGSEPDPLVVELSLRGTAQELALGPLDPEATAAAFGVDATTAAELAQRAGGNPLFMGHLVEHLRATGSLDGMPATLRAALHARLTQLEEADLEVLRAGALEGMEFTAAAVAAALGRPVAAVAARSIVEGRGTIDWPDGTHTAAFGFAHAVFRDVVLETIPPGRRAELHRRLAERLEAAFGASPETAQAIAIHYLAGGRPAPAVRFLRLAARQCAGRRAFREGIELLRQAIDAASELPDGPLRLRTQTELLSDLGQAYVAIDGWSSPEALAHLERARETAESLADREPLASVSLALATLYEVRGEPTPALDAVHASAGVADQGVEGAELLACALFHQGAFTRALEEADRGVAAFEAGAHSGHDASLPAMFGNNAAVACYDWAALSLCFLGHAEESMRRALSALELSEEPERAYSAATARAQMAALRACRQEPEETLRWAQATIDAARERGYAYRVAMGRVLRGWARAADGRPDGVEELARGLRASRETGANMEDPFYLGLLADAHLRGGSVEPGLAAVDEALSIATRERAHYYDAELHRLRGELLLAAGRPPEEAEAPIREALTVAREQGARALELRAALSLVRALSGHGRVAEARAVLALAHEPLANEETPDVRAAAALLGGAPGAVAVAPVFERRRITVLAWEIDRLAELAEHLDPEQLGAVTRACRAAVRTAAGAEGGHVATEHDSGGLAYFGYPRAVEDGPLRAVRAARALAGTVTMAGDDRPVRLSAGVDTGIAVVGPVEGSTVVIGPTPRTAHRLAAGAPPGAVVISDPTRALCRGYFGFAPHDGGHRVTGETGARTRLEAATEELSPLVGRERELGLLEGRWDQAAHGLGQAVFLTGEAGIGKSRLVRELGARLGLDAGTLLEFQCSDARADSALHPVADHFRRRLAGEPRGVEALLAEAGSAGTDAAPVIAALLNLPDAARLEPEVLRRRTADVVIGYVLAHADRRPVVAVVEDVHWADPSTLGLVEDLLGAIAEARVLLIVTFRPSLRTPWGLQSHVSHLSLSRCTPSEAQELIAHVAHATLPPEVARTIVERGDGVPLFIEELTRAAVAGADEIPATLDDSLLARLDALGPAAKAVAELGALIAREFPGDLLAAASELPRHELESGLDRLVQAELLRRRDRTLPGRYAFRHALLQQAVRRSMADRRRRLLHLRIAGALEGGTAGLAPTEPDVVAHHLEEAGEPARAIPYRAEAGRLALSRSANLEAVDQLTHAIADLDSSPDGRGDDLELDLRIQLGNALISVRGYASPDVEACYSRARELCRRTGEDVRLLPVLYGLWVNAFVRARHAHALELGRELRELAERRAPRALIVGERTVGWPLVCMGRFAEARAHLDRIPGLHQAAHDEPLRFQYGQDPAVAGLATGAWALWGRGEDEAADARAEAAIALARTTEHPMSIVYALGTGALLAALQRDARAARRRAVEAIALTDEFRAPLWHAWSLYALGGAELAEGDPQRAAATLRAGLSGARETGAALYEPLALTMLAECEASAGRLAEARRCLDEADAMAERNGERFWQPQTRRARHDLLARGA